MRVSLHIQLTTAQIAEAFCELGDEAQAQVFIEIAKISGGWGPGNFQQWRAVGRHLRDCTCSSDAAREIVQDIAAGMRPDCQCGGTRRVATTSVAYGVASQVSVPCPSCATTGKGT